MEIKLPKYHPIPRAEQLNQITYKQATGDARILWLILAYE
jgi:hypothetical protein